MNVNDIEKTIMVALKSSVHIDELPKTSNIKKVGDFFYCENRCDIRVFFYNNQGLNMIKGPVRCPICNQDIGIKCKCDISDYV